MPRYEFFCPDCEQRFERELSIEQRDHTVRCPNCHGYPAVRIASTPNFVINGYSAKNGYSNGR